MIALARGGQPALQGQWYLLDGASGLLLAVISVVGLCSALRLTGLPAHAAGAAGAPPPARAASTTRALFLFWAALLAVPIAGNLAAAWLIVEATTAASALLVAFTGRRDALEAGWKYLLLTTLGLSVALLGIVVLAIGQANAGHHGLHALDWHALRLAAHAAAEGADAARVRAAARRARDEDRLGAGPQLAARRPQRGAAADQRAAVRGAAAERAADRLAGQADPPALRRAPGRRARCSSRFGLASMLVAVPFLWRSLPWKRLLAYSSLEHMGVIALGIGFGTPLAIAGVVLHVAGHALAKSLGFYAALPLLRVDPRPPSSAAARRGRREPVDRRRDGCQPRARSPGCPPRRCSCPSC